LLGFRYPDAAKTAVREQESGTAAMSKGPGRIERAIEAVLDAAPDTVSLICAARFTASGISRRSTGWR
jgi:hypothetical protein